MNKMILAGLGVAVMAGLGMAGAANAQDAGYCREYQQKVTIGGVVKNTYGTACMQPDGSWRKTDADVAGDDVAHDMVMTSEPVQTVQVVQAQPTVVYEQPYYVQQPVVYPSVGLSFGFNDWGGGRGGDWHGGGGHGGGWHR